VHVRVGADSGIAEQIPRAAHRFAAFEYDEAFRRTLHLQVAGSANPRQPCAHDYYVDMLHRARNYPRRAAVSTVRLATKKHKRTQSFAKQLV